MAKWVDKLKGFWRKSAEYSYEQGLIPSDTFEVLGMKLERNGTVIPFQESDFMDDPMQLFTVSPVKVGPQWLSPTDFDNQGIPEHPILASLRRGVEYFTLSLPTREARPGEWSYQKSPLLDAHEAIQLFIKELESRNAMLSHPWMIQFNTPRIIISKDDLNSISPKILDPSQPSVFEEPQRRIGGKDPRDIRPDAGPGAASERDTGR
jgi:hypothetical protein